MTAVTGSPSRSTRWMSPRGSHRDVCVGRVETMISSKSTSRIASRTAVKGSGPPSRLPEGAAGGAAQELDGGFAGPIRRPSRTWGISSVNSVDCAFAREGATFLQELRCRSAVPVRPRRGPSWGPAGLHLRRTAYGPRWTGSGCSRAPGCSSRLPGDPASALRSRVRQVRCRWSCASRVRGGCEGHSPASEPCEHDVRRSWGWSHKPSPVSASIPPARRCGGSNDTSRRRKSRATIPAREQRHSQNAWIGSTAKEESLRRGQGRAPACPQPRRSP